MAECTPQTIEPERTQLRRNQVLDAASVCFRRFGFHGCSMALLAKESAMSVGHIYHYFANKEAIIAAIVTRDLSESMDEIDQLQSSEQLHEDMLNSLDKPIARSLNPENAALQCEILAEAARNPNVAAIVRSAHAQVREHVSKLLLHKDPALSPQQLGAKVEILGALFDGLMLQAIRKPQIDRDALLAIYRSTVQHILNN